eukprot:9610474-Ditylum_brightwellii.AAC.1
MILRVHSDASYLFDPKARSRGGLFLPRKHSAPPHEQASPSVITNITEHNDISSRGGVRHPVQECKRGGGTAHNVVRIGASAASNPNTSG